MRSIFPLACFMTIFQAWIVLAEDPKIEVKKLDLTELDMSADDAIQGKPFELETPKCYYHWRGKYNPPPVALTDARSADTPTEDIMIQGADEISLRWDLGSIPPEGRQLKQIRLFWSMADSARNGINVKFAVHDAAAGKWIDLFPYFKVEPEASRGNTFKSMTVTFPDNSVAGFDSIRMTDGSPLVKRNTTRWIELDVLTAPAADPAK